MARREVTQGRPSFRSTPGLCVFGCGNVRETVSLRRITGLVLAEFLLRYDVLAKVTGLRGEQKL